MDAFLTNTGGTPAFMAPEALSTTMNKYSGKVSQKHENVLTYVLLLMKNTFNEYGSSPTCLVRKSLFKKCVGLPCNNSII